MRQSVLRIRHYLRSDTSHRRKWTDVAYPKRAKMDDVPIIDIAAARAGCDGLSRVASEIGAAARGIGFFSVSGHGVPEDLRAEMFAASRAFFALPTRVKDEFEIEKSPQYLGYARMAFEKLDPSRPGDAKESFNMSRERAADDPDLPAGTPSALCSQWPRDPIFRATMLRYFDALFAVGAIVHRALAVDLDLPVDYFAPAYDRSSALRVLHYPPHPGAFDGNQFGAGPHTDYGGVTLLAQDDVAGWKCADATVRGSPSRPRPERSSVTSAMR